MKTSSSFQPKPEHKFTFGLWTVGNRGRDPFGDFVRSPLSPNDLAAMLGEVGAWGVNLHDNDLVPIDATPTERDIIVRDPDGHAVEIVEDTVAIDVFSPVRQDWIDRTDGYFKTA